MNRLNIVFAISILIGCAIPSAAEACTPPPLYFRVMVYYDGSPEFEEIYNETLLGLSEDISYQPAIETSDPAEFEQSLSSGEYDVLIAVTSDATEATDWAAIARGADNCPNYAMVCPDPEGGDDIQYTLIKQEKYLGPQPPEGSPSGPWTFYFEVVDGELVTISYQAPWLLKQLGFQSWDEFQNWLNSRVNDARNKAANIVDELADLFGELGDAKIKVRLKFDGEAGVPGTGLGWEVEVTFELTAEQAARFMKKVAGHIRPPCPPQLATKP